MNCSQCGEVCRCPSEPLPAGLAQWKAGGGPAPAGAVIRDAMVSDDDQVQDAELQDAETLSTESQHADAWRDELHARLSRYRARRKVRPPRYPSLRLQFEEPDRLASAAGGSGF